MKKLCVAVICASLGTGAALGVAACGEDSGCVKIEGGTTGKEGGTTGTTTDKAPTTPTTPTATISTETTKEK